MNRLKEYHLHKGDYSKLQLDINQSKIYCKKNAEHCFKPHRHTFYQIIWFKNQGTHFVDYTEYQHPKNSIFFLSTGQVHSFCRESENNGYLIHFNDIFLQKESSKSSNQIQFRLFDEVGTPFIVLPSSEVKNFEHLIEQLIYEVKNTQHNYKQQLYYYIQILLLNIDRLKRDDDIQIKPDHHFGTALRFKKMVKKYKNEFKSVSFFSQLLGVSDKTLNSISKKYYNDTPANFIHKTRILEAKRLLSNTNLTKKEIAYQLGFDQPTYFSKYFKKHTSLTPNEFQKRFL